jgi:hypothetical protein
VKFVGAAFGHQSEYVSARWWQQLQRCGRQLKHLSPSFTSSLAPAGGVFSHNQGMSAPTGTAPTPVESIEEIKVVGSGMTADV